MYTSIASSQMFNTCFIHCQRHLSGRSSTTLPGLTTSWYSIMWSEQTTGCVIEERYPSRAATHWIRSCLGTPVEYYMINWRLSTSTWIDSHPITCWVQFLLLPALWTIWICGSRFVFSETTFIESQRTDRCLWCFFVSVGGALVQVPVKCLDGNGLALCWSVGGAVIRFVRMQREMITTRSRKS